MKNTIQFIIFISVFSLDSRKPTAPSTAKASTAALTRVIRIKELLQI